MTDTPVSATLARKSTAIVGLVLAALAAWQAYRGRPLPMDALGGAAGLLLAAAALSEGASRAFHRRWMQLAAVLGWVNSRILLSLTFLLVIAPTGLARRAFGADPMGRRGPRRDSYWVPRDKTRPEPQSFERLF